MNQVLLAGLLLLFSLCATAQQMVFIFVPPREPVEVFGNAWQIYADGKIDANAAGRLDSLIKERDIPARSQLSLNSNGGSLLGGIALGRVIRKHGLYTDVVKRGREIIEKPIEKIERSYQKLPGECFSACAFAYIGGTFRFFDKSAKFGVHRFYSKGEELGADSAQVASGVLIAYIGEMGVNQDLYAEMTKAGRDDLNILSPQQLTSLGIVNNGDAKAVWSIESAGNAVYLKGERETARGINKFMVVCSGKTPYLHVIFDPEGRGEQLLDMEAHSLLLDDEVLPISNFRVGKQTIVNGWINVDYKLSPALVTKLQSARSVGIAFQYVTTAPVFYGFRGMEMDSQKLRAYLGTCR